MMKNCLNPDDWKFNWLTSWDEIEDADFTSQWQKWFDYSNENANIFFSPAITGAWYRTYKSEHINPRFLIATCPNELTVIFPLVISTGRLIELFQRRLIPAGFDDFDYQDPIFVGETSDEIYVSFWQRFFREIEKQNDFDIVVIPRIRENFALPEDNFKETDRAPFIDISQFDSFDDWYDTLPRSFRKEIRRKQRNLNNDGMVELEIYQKNETARAINEFLPQFLYQHQQRWPDSHRPELLYKNIITSALPKGLVELSVLKFNDEPISWSFHFKNNAYYYCYIAAWDWNFRQYSPGTIHLSMLLKQAIENRIKIFDLMRGQEQYKSFWTDTSIALMGRRYIAKGFMPKAKYFWNKKTLTKLRKIKSFCVRTGR